jgi:twinkle protein
LELIGFGENRAKLGDLYDNGRASGSLTGWPSLDRHYTVGAEQFTVVTGIPSHGKSEWLDALMVNLLSRPLNGKPWRFLVCSPENWPIELHQAKLLEKIIGLRFGNERGFLKPGRMTREEMEMQARLLGGRVTFVSLGEGETFPDLLERMDVWCAAEPGYQSGVILDPWNQLDHERPRHLSETEYISLALTLSQRITRKTKAHLWIVAHPQKLLRDRDGTRPVPTLYDISGSAHWYNKCDNGITVWRDVDAQPPSNKVEIHIQKVRHKHIGRPGLVVLRYDVRVGRYHEISEEEE